MISELNHFILGGPEGDCWEWQRYTDKRGYGQVRYQGKLMYAHRLSFMVHNPEVSCEGLLVRHKCDNPKCINPAHLEVGTPADNMQDKVERGRQSRLNGSNNPNCKLSDEEVQEIRELKGKHTQAAIGELYGISKHTVSAIQRGLIWK